MFACENSVVDSALDGVGMGVGYTLTATQMCIRDRLYAVHGKANILHDPYYNPNLTMYREDFSESNDLRGLKEGRITVQWRK